MGPVQAVTLAVYVPGVSGPVAERLAGAPERLNIIGEDFCGPTIAHYGTEEQKAALLRPILTGEDIYLLDGFQELIDRNAVSMVHPDLATSGGLLETKKIGDYAMKHGISMVLHMAGSPVTLNANSRVSSFLFMMWTV